MFTAFDIVYYLLFITTLILSFKATNQNIRGLILLRVLLIVGLTTELGVDLADHYYEAKYSNLLHSIYIPIEFVLLSMFLLKASNQKMLDRLIVLSIPVYMIFTCYYFVELYSFDKYPGILYNIGCVFIIVWTVIILFNLEVQSNLNLIQIPLFWLAAGIIILYMGVFFFNAVYNYLIVKKTELATALRLIINLNLNYIFYSIWSYAFICSIRLKKYSIR